MSYCKNLSFRFYKGRELVSTWREKRRLLQKLLGVARDADQNNQKRALSKAGKKLHLMFLMILMRRSLKGKLETFCAFR